MSAERELERVVRSWIREDGREDADRVLNTVLAEVDATPQRRARWLARRNLKMNPTWRVVAAVGVVVLVAAVGFAIASGSNVGQDDASPTPSPFESAAASPDQLGMLPPAGAVIPAGTYTTAFDPPFRVTIPEGWRVGGDTADEFGLNIAAIDVGFFICHDSRAVDPANNELPSVGTDAESVITALSERADLRDMTEPQPVEIGGLDGYYVDFLGPRPSSDIPPAPSAIGGDCGIDTYPGQLSRIGVLDGPDGNIGIVIFSHQGDQAVIEAATEIVTSIEFDLP